jgi:predicted permease
MGTLLSDMRYGLRMLLKSPGFTLLVVLSLALGIGANSAVFSTINTLMLRTLPVHDPHTLYLLQWSMKTMQIDPLIDNLEGGEGKDPRTGGATSYSISYPAYQHLQKSNTVFSDTFAFAANEQEANVGLGGTASSAVAQGVSGNLFEGLGVSPILGRAILPADDVPSTTPVAVASYAFWKKQMGGDLGAIGKTISMNGTPLTIVGVAPAEFFGLDPGVAPDLWIPLRVYAQQMGSQSIDPASLLTGDKIWWLGVVGRLKPGLSMAEASTQLNLLFSQSIRAYNLTLPAGLDMPQVELLPAAKGLNSLREQFSTSLFLLMGMVGLVLIIACANIAGLLLARAASRQREIAMRISLGATKARVIRQVLTESATLGALGGAAALVIAQAVSAVLVALLASGQDPVHVTLHLDAHVLAFTAAVSILSGIVFGLAPALAAIQVQPLTVLKQSGATATMSAKRFRAGKLLVGAQIALSFLLLICAGVLLRSLQSLQRVNLGFDRRCVVLFTVRPGLNGYSGQRLISYYEELKQRIRSIPGVRSAAFAQRNPIGEGGSITLVEVPGYTSPGKHINAYRHIVGEGYFDTLRIPVLLGRTIGPQDTSASQPVVVINQAFAKKYFHGDNPVGHEIQFGPHVEPVPMQVVGVVQDVKYEHIRDEAPPTLYVAYTQARSVSPLMTYGLRISGDKAAMVRSIEREALSVDAGVPVVNIRTEDEVVDQVLYLERTFAMLSSAFGGLALLLACVGVYGTIAYRVAQRTNEIGIRMALGAERANILKMILRETLVVVGGGLLVGLPLVWLATRMLSAQLYGLSAHDPLTLGIAILVIAAVTITAGLVPARRASKIDPIRALRYE